MIPALDHDLFGAAVRRLPEPMRWALAIMLLPLTILVGAARIFLALKLGWAIIALAVGVIIGMWMNETAAEIEHTSDMPITDDFVRISFAYRMLLFVFGGETVRFGQLLARKISACLGVCISVLSWVRRAFDCFAHLH